MGRRKKPRDDRSRPSMNYVAAGAEVQASFQAMVKSLRCPHCNLEFTDFAIAWGEAWKEGWRDLEFEQGALECSRDGPFKLKCELCGHRSWLDYFVPSVSSAERTDAEPGRCT